MLARRPLVLSHDLEAAILSAILKGAVDLDVVQPGELSKSGRMVLGAIGLLKERGINAPYGLRSVYLAATEVLGADKGSFGAYLRGVHSVSVVEDVGEIVQKVRDKQLLVELVNAAAGQLQRGSIDVGELNALLTQRPASSLDLVPVCELLKEGLPKPPVGVGLRSLPSLNQATGGIYGVWVIGGEPKVGKSTLAWQIGLDIAADMNVLYYDPENGFPVMMDHTAKVFDNDLDRIRLATRRLYYRDSIRSLDSDLSRIQPPALVVVDNIQKLPSNIEYRREGLDKWMHRFEALKKRGYHCLLVSEINRASYGSTPGMGGYKETGEIEYTADLGIQLLRSTDGMAEVHVVANRHHPFNGFLGYLARHKDWWWRET